MSDQQTLDAAALRRAPRQFREVLGHFPTGIVAITACEEDGTPQGMVVGSFTSVSLDPPLVAFLPDKGSSTFPRIRKTGRFCVNVLASDQQDVCRTLAVRGSTERFDNVGWHPSALGSPVLDDVVAWIDCEIDTIHEAGDHFIVVGAVRDLEVVRPTVPLLFFQGGYGAFAHGSMVLGGYGDMREQVRLADIAIPDLEALAEETGVNARAVARMGSQSVIVAISSAQFADAATSSLGVAIPLAPPFGAIFRAWAGDAAIDEWLATAPSIDEDRRLQILDDLDVIRRHGWVLTLRDEIAGDVASALDAVSRYGQTPGLDREFHRIAARMIRHADPAGLDEEMAAQTMAMSAPAFGPDGQVALSVSLVDIPSGSSLRFVLNARNRLLAAAGAITTKLGGA
jgi:flavin reductase (DIM6/NTAB) family NADH-FMN oxidoreductase RutF/DNA-binding IclR family transcriptional regulator